MPLIIEWEGYKFYFHKSEVLFEPAHVHVKGHGGDMKIWLSTRAKKLALFQTAYPTTKKLKF